MVTIRVARRDDTLLVCHNVPQLLVNRVRRAVRPQCDLFERQPGQQTNSLGVLASLRGDFAAAASLIAEADANAEATGTRFARYAAVLLATFRGDEGEASALIEAEMRSASAAGQGLGIQFCHWTSGILYNGLGRYEQALTAARQASEQLPELWISAWGALPELIEAATRTGKGRLAGEAL